VKRKRNADETHVKSERDTNNNELTMINNENNTLPDKSATTKTLEERKSDFKLKVIGMIDVLGRDETKAFFEYWTEHNENGKKMRFEMEKTFGLSRRLATWKKKDKSGSRFGENRPNVELLTTAKMYS